MSRAVAATPPPAALRVGVVGVGAIGQDHVRRLAETVAGAEVVALADADESRALAVEADLLPGARVHRTGEEVVADPDVDAVVVASWGDTHEAYVLACLEAGMPVFCEKPLAVSAPACQRVVDAEVALGRRLVQVGYMRRYDPAYRALRDTVTSGSIGRPLLAHCVHRNPSVAGFFTADSLLTDSLVHEVDVTRWLLEDEVSGVRVLTPPRSSQAPEGLLSPLLVVLDMVGGALVDVELGVAREYGYDVRAEVVGETGTASLTDGPAAPASGWRERFAEAYDVELQAWVDDVVAGRCTGPSSWDGYAAAVVTEACRRSLAAGERVEVELSCRPALYEGA